MSDRLTQLAKLRQADASDPDVPYMMAQEHARLGDIESAIRAYDECLALDPTYVYAFFHKAKALELADRIDEALLALREGVERARACGNAKALNELRGYLDALEP
jgi:tetratricopeptide (TPR) repeat protein